MIRLYIITASGQNFTSAMTRGGLKKANHSNSPKLKKVLSIKEEFLPKKKRVSKVTFDHLHQAIKADLTDDMNQIFSLKIFRASFAHAKMTQMYSGKKQKSMDLDKERAN